MSIFKYSNVASYLRHHISQLPKNGRGEVTRIASRLNVSPTLISHVLSGEKTLTAEQGQSLVNYLGLIEIEADAFTFMVQLERAGSHELKKYWKQKLSGLREMYLKLASRLESDRKLSDERRAVFYSTPLYMKLRLYTSVGEKGKSLSEIASRFELSPLKCAEMMSFLVECGLCKLENDRYSMGAQKIHLERTSPHLLRFQTDWRMLAIARGEDLTDNELGFTAPVSLSKKDFEFLREEIIVFIKHFLKTVHASPAEEIACLNLDFFWIKK
jgi:transcriptional regulator with XRE-family HTH domain